jgi:hypothetical protein
MFHTEYVTVYMTYLQTEFYEPRSSCSLVIAMKPNVKCSCRAGAILFYVIKKVAYFFKDIYYHTKFQDSTLDVVNVAHTTEICTAILLVL